NIAVSSGGDVAITFSRVSENEYVGAYYTIIPHDFNPGFADTWENYPLYEGRANYVLTLNGESNRWGDYNGAWSDPLDDNTFWIFTEYAKSKDVWGTRLGAVRLQPYDVPYVNIIEKEIDFGVKELSSSSLVELEISNLGSPDLLISGINSDGGRFSIVNSAFPLTITGSGSEIVQIAFNPTEHGQEVNDTLRVISNDPNNSEYKIAVKGKGFELIKAVKSTLYASSVSDNGDGNISSLDRNSAAPTLIGYTGFNKVESIAIHPETSEVYGLVKNEEGPHVLVKLRGTDGEGMVYMPAPVQIHRFAFDNNGLIHAVTDDSTYYTINSTTFEATMVRQLVHQVRAITVNPATNDVLISWAFPETDDRIVKLLPNGFINIVGSTGQGQNINTLTFDDEGNMYGTVGKPGLINLLLKIDPANGSATTVGNTNLKNIVGLAFASDGITGVNDKLVLPEIFTLEQNYPNPFNPSTNIRFNLPESGNVTLTLFNAIGEKITDLIKGNLSAGQHSLVVDASVTSQLSSGIYIYKLSVNSISGKNFSESKKMMLLK
ncbi:MAG: T9SS type A sorting domain-containing protein, partial [Melioribacteraceae bacterium]|nr:T9SS type A sorting domain-containing protein [Melioribacteraceae bacterium]